MPWIYRYEEGTGMAIKIGAIKYQECSAKSQVCLHNTPCHGRSA